MNPFRKAGVKWIETCLKLSCSNSIKGLSRGDEIRDSKWDDITIFSARFKGSLEVVPRRDQLTIGPGKDPLFLKEFRPPIFVVFCPCNDSRLLGDDGALLGQLLGPIGKGNEWKMDKSGRQWNPKLPVFGLVKNNQTFKSGVVFGPNDLTLLVMLRKPIIIHVFPDLPRLLFFRHICCCSQSAITIKQTFRTINLAILHGWGQRAAAASLECHKVENRRQQQLVASWMIQCDSSSTFIAYENTIVSEHPDTLTQKLRHPQNPLHQNLRINREKEHMKFMPLFMNKILFGRGKIFKWPRTKRLGSFGFLYLLVCLWSIKIKYFLYSQRRLIQNLFEQSPTEGQTEILPDLNFRRGVIYLRKFPASQKF